jgi:hypothetical protein
MAKKSKVVKNDRRRAVVARYAQRRAELKHIIGSPSSSAGRRARRKRNWPASPATPARCDCAIVMQSTGVHAAICASSECPGCGCVSWLMTGSYPGCGKRAGSGQETCAHAPGALAEKPRG